MASPPFESSSRPPAVLVVDDLPINRLILKNMCSKLGFNVLEAADGNQCLQEFAAHAPEVCAVLMDLKMPHLSGWEAAFQLRALENLHYRHHLEPAGTCPDYRMCDEDVESSKCITTPVMPGNTVRIDQLAVQSTISTDQQASHSTISTEQLAGLTGRRRVPIIACTATNPQESMSWFINSRGVPHMQPYPHPRSVPHMQPYPHPRSVPHMQPYPHPRSVPYMQSNASLAYGPQTCGCGCRKQAWARTAPATPLSSSPCTYTMAAEQEYSHAACEQHDPGHAETPQSATAGVAVLGPTADGAGVLQLDALSLPDDLPYIAAVQPPPSVSSADGNLHSPADVSMLDEGDCVCSNSTDTWCTSTVAQAARFAGIDQVLVKPVRMSILEATLDAWLPGWRGLVTQRATAATCSPSPCTPAAHRAAVHLSTGTS